MSSEPKFIPVYAQNNLRGVATLDSPRPGEVRVRFDSGRSIVVPTAMLTPRGDGAFDLSLGTNEMAAFQSPDEAHPGGEVLPVVEERLVAGKRAVETGKVVVRKLVHQREEEVAMPLERDRVEVERVSVNRYVDRPESERQEGDVTIIPVYEEVLVVEKRLLLKEEVRIVRHHNEEPFKQAVVLRREEVQVDRIPQEPDSGAS